MSRKTEPEFTLPTEIDRMEAEESFLDPNTATLWMYQTTPPFKKWSILVKGEDAPKIAILVMKLLQQRRVP